MATLEHVVEQPALPLFPDKVATYEVVQPHGPNGEYPEQAWKTVSVPVDAIEDIPDARLRAALWDQFTANERGENFAILNFVNPDGSYRHSISVLRARRFPESPVVFTQDGLFSLDEAKERRQTIPETERKQQSAGFIARLFQKRR